ncbi:unnamed protein product, partial [Rotaria magnacalcarata]
FVRQWSGASIQGQIIECIASLSRNDQANREPNQQREFRPSTEPKTQREDFDLPNTRSLLMSTNTSETLHARTNDVATDSQKLQPPRHRPDRNRNTLQYQHKRALLFQQTTTS